MLLSAASLCTGNFVMSRSEAGGDDGASSIGGSAQKLKRSRRSGSFEETADETYMESLRNAKMQRTLDNISAFLTDKPDVADLVLFQLESGKFEKKEKLPVSQVRSLPKSANKMRLISAEFWQEILHLVNSIAFAEGSLAGCQKMTLAKLGCRLGRIDLSSAPPSKKLHVIAHWIQRRDISLGTCIPDLRYIRGDDTLIKDIDWDQSGPFKRCNEVATGASQIIHRSTGSVVPCPLGTPATASLRENFVETASTIQGEYSPIAVQYIFLRNNVPLPDVINWAAVPDPSTIDAAQSPAAAASIASSSAGGGQAAGVAEAASATADEEEDLEAEGATATVAGRGDVTPTAGAAPPQAGAAPPPEGNGDAVAASLPAPSQAAAAPTPAAMVDVVEESQAAGDSE